MDLLTYIKSIVRPFKLGGQEYRLIRSAVINWRPGNFFKTILLIQSHERNIKPYIAA
jgi:hypothetical protein